jgi:hypothetical protein
MALWNWLMPEIFGLKTLTYCQAWGFDLAFKRICLASALLVDTREECAERLFQHLHCRMVPVGTGNAGVAGDNGGIKRFGEGKVYRIIG